MTPTILVILVGVVYVALIYRIGFFQENSDLFEKEKRSGKSPAYKRDALIGLTLKTLWLSFATGVVVVGVYLILTLPD